MVKAVEQLGVQPPGIKRRHFLIGGAALAGGVAAIIGKELIDRYTTTVQTTTGLEAVNTPPPVAPEVIPPPKQPTNTLAPTLAPTDVPPPPTATAEATKAPEAGYTETWGNVTLITEESLQKRETNPIQRVILNPESPNAQERLNDTVFFGHARALKISIEELKNKIAAGEEVTYEIIGSQGEGNPVLKSLQVNAAKPVIFKFVDGPTVVYATEAVGFGYTVLESGELVITISYKGSETSSWEGGLVYALANLNYPAIQTGSRNVPWPAISDADLKQFISLVREPKGTSFVPIIKAVK